MRQASVLKKSDTEIDFQDQQKINAFARANLKVHEIRAELKKMKEETDNLEDAAGLVEESFGEELKLFSGECFVTVNEDQAAAHVEALVERKQ